MHDGPYAARSEPGFADPSAMSRKYAPILLVATAVFLLVLVLARSPLEGYIVSQKIQAADDRAMTTAPLATEQVAAWIKTDAVLAATVQQVCPRDSLASQNDLIRQLQSGLSVKPLSAEAANSSWQLALQHRDRQLASRLITKLSQSLTEQLKHLDQSEAQLLVQHYQKVLTQARDEEEFARQTLERARHEQLAAAMQAAERETKSSSAVAANQVNPAWQALQQKLQLAKARLDQLLSARTPEHPQVIEAEAQLGALQSQLNATPQTLDGSRAEEGQHAPALRGPQLQEAARNDSRLSVRLISSAGESADVNSLSSVGHIQQLTAAWSTATGKRTMAERQWSEAQQQWVRGLNTTGWQTSPAWTQLQVGGRVQPFQCLLAGALALCAGLGTWRISYLVASDGSLMSVAQLAETLPLPVLGEVPLTTELPRRTPERMSWHLQRLTQLSLAIIAAVILVSAWASAADSNLSAQWTSDPASTLGQAFDLLHHRVLG
ncbi:hypothetical protein ETAA8_58540 [Anatilimnocola aggregata]|uniref:Uncharacterized protein n=1 Tax=Anatilimnocola aggregata TaxID=2528021 RepID=A0A517YKG6_9BACT|nr:hypothetical protein [Anatilimnocola aggregata]QDU30706.1 hypothetical protein ETAA8_58540 [Anatilimnocola aggregata]